MILRKIRLIANIIYFVEKDTLHSLMMALSVHNVQNISTSRKYHTLSINKRR